MSNVVLVIDMVKGFLEPGHNLYCGDDSREIIPRVHSLLTREQEAGSEILFNRQVGEDPPPLGHMRDPRRAARRPRCRAARLVRHQAVRTSSRIAQALPDRPGNFAD